MSITEGELCLQLARLRQQGIRVSEVYLEPSRYDALEARLRSAGDRPWCSEPQLELRLGIGGPVRVLRDKETCPTCRQEVRR